LIHDRFETVEGPGRGGVPRPGDRTSPSRGVSGTVRLSELTRYDDPMIGRSAPEVPKSVEAK
jgi:hypothetical protein